MFQIETFTFNVFQENTYVLYNESGEGIIIDPGFYFPQENTWFQQFINKQKLTPRYLLNTHCHLDHVFGNKWVAETYGLELHINELDMTTLELSQQSGAKYGLPFEGYEGGFTYLKAGDKIVLGEDMLEVLFVPGHAPGHIAFYCAQQNFIISGDVLFQNSIGRTDLPGCNHADLENSIRNVLYQLPDNTVVYSGHGAPTTIGNEKKSNPFVRP